MDTLEDRLERLGAHVRAEIATSSVGDPTATAEPSDVRRVGRLAARRWPASAWRLVPAAAAACLAVVAGVIVVDWRTGGSSGGSSPTVGAPAAEAPAVRAVGAAPGVSYSGTGSPPSGEGGLGPFQWDDAQLLTRLNSFLDAGTAEEQAQAFSAPRPAAEIASCVADAGFRYIPDDPLLADPRYSMSPEDFAARYGLGILAQANGTYPRATTEEDVYVTSLGGAQADAYYGVLDRCQAGNLDSGEIAWLRSYTAALNHFRDVVIPADDRVLAATAEWSQCLADAGFAFDSPQQMRNVVWGWFTSTGSEFDARFQEELAVATANVPCQAAYDQTVRAVTADRLDEFKTLIESGDATDEVPNGFR